MSHYRDPGEVCERLAEIAGYLQTRAPEIEKSIASLHVKRAKLELEMAKARRVLKDLDSLTVAEKTARVIESVEEEGGLYSKVAELEGCVEGARAAMRVLDRESSNLQSLLAQMRAEAGYAPTNPAPYA